LETNIAVFRGKEIRKTIHKNEWWFVINDVIESLTDSSDPAQYFKRLKQRDAELAELTDKGGVQFVPPLMLEVETSGGRQKMYCWNTEGIFRLIQSIPSRKAEPFKRWLAKVGYERGDCPGFTDGAVPLEHIGFGTVKPVDKIHDI